MPLTSWRVSHLSNSLKDNFIPRGDHQLCLHGSYRCPDFRADKIMCSLRHLSVAWKGKPFLTSQQTGRNLEDQNQQLHHSKVQGVSLSRKGEGHYES